VAVFFHPLAALVLCDFRFTSLFKGTHGKKLAEELRGVVKRTGKADERNPILVVFRFLSAPHRAEHAG